MGKNKKKQRAPKGARGVSADAIRKEGVKLETFSITENAWQNFWRTNEGKDRLARMRGLTEMRINRYRELRAGNFLKQPTDKETYKVWKTNQNEYNIYDKPKKVEAQ